MIFLPPGCRIFAYSEAIDMRWAFEKLSYLIREKMGEDISKSSVCTTCVLFNNSMKLKIFTLA